MSHASFGRFKISAREMASVDENCMDRSQSGSSCCSYVHSVWATQTGDVRHLVPTRVPSSGAHLWGRELGALLTWGPARTATGSSQEHGLAVIFASHRFPSKVWVCSKNITFLYTLAWQTQCAIQLLELQDDQSLVSMVISTCYLHHFQLLDQQVGGSFRQMGLPPSRLPQGPCIGRPTVDINAW